jgi:hypothetical protein
MPILIDDEPVELDGLELGQLLVAAQQRVEPLGRMIVEVAIDGQAVFGEDLATREHDAVTASEVRLTTADPHELAGAVLRQVRQKLDEAAEAQAEAAELFQRDQPGDALRRVGEALAIWQQTAQGLLNSAAAIRLDLNATHFDGEPILTLINSLIDQLKQLRELVQAGDTVALADALAYEWPDTTAHWQRLMDQVLERIGSSVG